ncbi:MAG: ABC transporter permease [Chitinophagaceae bacterium]
MMANTFFRSTFRYLRKNKTYSFLNIFGLAIGIACAGLIFLWVESELGYDSMYAKKDRLYRLLENQTYDGTTRTFWSTPALMGPAIKTEVPGITDACRTSSRELLFSQGDKSVYEKGLYADASLFSMFMPAFIQGNARDAFSQPQAVVITSSMAQRFFGNNGNVIGSTLRLDNATDYTVAGVISDWPARSTLQADWIIPFDVYYRQNEERIKSWGTNSITTYVELAPAADPAAVNKQLYDFIEKKMAGADARAFLFAMSDWRLRDHFEDGRPAGGRIEYVRTFSIVAWIILLIACINYMNLATARSEKRAKEVGMHKVLGAGKRSLVLRFIGEALLLSAIAVVLGVVLILLALPLFNGLVQGELVADLANPVHSAALLAIALVCGLVAGSYPALYLSSFNPLSVFKTGSRKSTGAATIRKGLVVVQFAVSIVLIIGTVIIFRQVQHVRSRAIGYDRSNLLSLNVRGDMVKNFGMIRQDLVQSGLVENAALNSFNTFSIGNNSSSFAWDGKDPASDILVSYRNVTPGFVATLGMKILDGRDFRDVQSDSLSVLITQSMATLMGSQSIIGKTLYGRDSTAYQVAGVVNDMVYGDMYGKGDPVVFFCKQAGARYMYIKARPGVALADVLAKIKTVLARYNPAYPFEYSFVDDQFNQLFKSEMLTGKLAWVFAALAIFISCLGLFGLSAFMAEQRKKEIGIRKVLGASVPGIAGLLSKDFIKLIGLAMLVGFPVAWWAMQQWLQQYDYRIGIGAWIFVAAAGIAILVALLTISFQTIRAAMVNPVKSLRAT